ncbi:MAG: hypothetical protein AAGF85_02495 [Bacteroidota bacterium]
MVHEYFKKEFKDFKILLQLNPISYSVLELTVHKDNSMTKRKVQVDEDIYEDLNEDEFEKSSPIEFNLHLKSINLLR